MTSTDQAAMSHDAEAECLPAGFRYAGVAGGIKPSGKLDVSLIVSDDPVVAGGVYTRNQVVAAPVLLCRKRTPSSRIRAVVTNSGNANACTGPVGMENAEAMCRRVAERVGCDAEEVLVMSTGVIGKQLPMDCINAGIDDACGGLDGGVEAFHKSAEAILTTDKDRKSASRSFAIDGQSYSIAAMAKGAGMISPNMATMLAVLLTDAPLSQDLAQSVVADAAEKSFNQVSVDGHTSTNDTMLLLSSGRGTPLDGSALDAFRAQLTDIAIDLAKLLVADGEGASHVMAIRVTGAQSDVDAELIARTVAASPLVKTAITGGDPNWGRIVSAAGYADAVMEPEQTCLQICGQSIYHDGTPVEYNEADLSAEMKRNEEVAIDLKVGNGPGEARFWSSDLTTEYVRFNSEYTT